MAGVMDQMLLRILLRIRWWHMTYPRHESSSSTEESAETDIATPDLSC